MWTPTSLGRSAGESTAIGAKNQPQSNAAGSNMHSEHWTAAESFARGRSKGVPKGRREGSRAGLERGGRAGVGADAENRKNPADPRPEPQIFKSLAEKSTPETSGENACFPISVGECLGYV